jgi:Domain of unknown function (DUF4194)
MEPIIDQKTETFAPVAIKLLQGALYDDDKYWNDLINLHEFAVRQYFEKIGLQLIIERSEGYAFLKQPDSDEQEMGLPKLIRKIPLTYEQSVLCVLLREKLEEHDSTANETRELFLSQRDIRDMLLLFYKERSTHARLLKDIKRYINDMEELRFLRCVNKSKVTMEDDLRYQVQRILKSLVTADDLQVLRKKIQSHIHETNS